MILNRYIKSRLATYLFISFIFSMEYTNYEFEIFSFEPSANPNVAKSLMEIGEKYPNVKIFQSAAWIHTWLHRYEYWFQYF